METVIVDFCIYLFFNFILFYFIKRIQHLYTTVFFPDPFFQIIFLSVVFRFPVLQWHKRKPRSVTRKKILTDGQKTQN